MRHIRNESPEEIAYARDMFETIFRDYPQEKDVHISTLLADLMNQRPVTAEELVTLPADARAIPGADWYVVDKDFTWTFAQPHEADRGPYFCRKA